MEKQNPARSLFLEESFGVLSTISLDLAGYPFGSVTPIAWIGWVVRLSISVQSRSTRKTSWRTHEFP
jgi:hypothetical protein